MEKKFKPILFSTEMVQANLDDKKKNTRRTQGLEIPNQNPDGYDFLGWDKNLVVFKSPEGKFRECKPKFNKGDILWVRETLYQNGELGLEYKADRESIADDLIPENFNVRVDKNGIYKFCEIPNIFMNKEFSRIFLKVTNVRCERLHDITEADAIAEGVSKFNHGYGGSPQGVWWKDYLHGGGHDQETARKSFIGLWKKINGKDSWKANPWVWVYEFKKIEKPAVWPQ